VIGLVYLEVHSLSAAADGWVATASPSSPEAPAPASRDRDNKTAHSPLASPPVGARLASLEEEVARLKEALDRQPVLSSVTGGENDTVHYLMDNRETLEFLVEENAPKVAWRRKEKKIMQTHAELAGNLNLSATQSARLEGILRDFSLRKVAIDRKFKARSSMSSPNPGTGVALSDEWDHLLQWLESRLVDGGLCSPSDAQVMAVRIQGMSTHWR